MENLVKIDSCKDYEEKEFSVIEVYPHLHYDTGYLLTDREDLNSLFQESLDRNYCSVNIHVRSEEAQEEIYSWLLGNDFEDVTKSCGNIKGQNECINHDLDLEEDEVPENPRSRRYYTESSDKYKFLISNSNLYLVVGFETYRLTEFKHVIKELRERRLYRNKWIDRNGKFVIR